MFWYELWNNFSYILLGVSVGFFITWLSCKNYFDRKIEELRKDMDSFVKGLQDIELKKGEDRNAKN